MKSYSNVDWDDDGGDGDGDGDGEDEDTTHKMMIQPPSGDREAKTQDYLNVLENISGISNNHQFSL
jgi:hypothetical protein